MEQNYTTQSAEASRMGIDLNLIDCCLALSYEERLIQHQRFLDQLNLLREAKQTYDQRFKPPTKSLVGKRH